MGIQENYLQIDRFLEIIHSDLLDFVSKRLQRLILKSYRENIIEFSEGVNIVRDSILKARKLLPLSNNERDLENKQSNFDLENKLAEHGLTGYELTRKLHIFYRTRDLFLEKYIHTPIKIARGFARRFLDAMNVVLDSLANVLPPLGAVKEFKNSIEVVI